MLGHDKTHLHDGWGGPKDPAVRYGPDEVIADLHGLQGHAGRTGQARRDHRVRTQGRDRCTRASDPTRVTRATLTGMALVRCRIRGYDAASRGVTLTMSAVSRLAADLMIGMEQPFGEQRTDVPASEPVHDPLPVALPLDQPGEPQLRQVLAGNSRPASGDRGEARDVELAVA